MNARRSASSLSEMLAQVTLERDRLKRENVRLREPVAYMADKSSWLGDPLSHNAVLYGHDTPYEMAVAALADCEAA